MPTVVHTVSATTSLSYEHVQRAWAGLRATLRYQLLDFGAAPDWSTLEVSGPVTTLDGMGRPSPDECQAADPPVPNTAATPWLLAPRNHASRVRNSWLGE
jgi:hypothetical protein